MGGLTAIEGRVYTRPCRMENDDVLFHIPKTAIFRTRYKELSIDGSLIKVIKV